MTPPVTQNIASTMLTRVLSPALDTGAGLSFDMTEKAVEPGFAV